MTFGFGSVWVGVLVGGLAPKLERCWTWPSTCELVRQEDILVSCAHHAFGTLSKTALVTLASHQEYDVSGCNTLFEVLRVVLRNVLPLLSDSDILSILSRRCEPEDGWMDVLSSGQCFELLEQSKDDEAIKVVEDLKKGRDKNLSYRDEFSSARFVVRPFLNTRRRSEEPPLRCCIVRLFANTSSQFRVWLFRRLSRDGSACIRARSLARNPPLYPPLPFCCGTVRCPIVFRCSTSSPRLSQC